MTTPGDTQQSNFQTNQNYDPDIRKMFKHYVTGGSTPDDNAPEENIGIDDIRAKISVSVTGTSTANLIKSLNIDPAAPPASTPNTSTPVLLAQESRCHAFYRIIGFPVVTSDMSQFYNPGLDVIKQKGMTRQITLADKISIAGKVGTKFESISGAREVWAANTAHVFSVPESIEAGVLSLTSGTYGSGGNINKRLFNAPFVTNTSLDPFDYNVADQQYPLPSLTSLVGQKEVLLALYQGPNATDSDPNEANINITTPSVFFTHQHIIVPFLVDPRIDFSVWASKSQSVSGLSKRIAVPFVPDASYLIAGSTATAQPPLLEKIIRKRVYQSTQDMSAGQAAADTVQYVKDFKTIQNITTVGGTTISNIFSNSIFNLSQQNAFADALSIIQSMMFKLVDSMRIVHAAQGKYYWLPQPSTSGPEGGSTVRPVPLNQFISSDLLTPNDVNIAWNQAQVFFSNLTSVTTQSNAIPDVGGSTAAPGLFSFTSDTSDSQGNVSSQTMGTINSTRNKKLSDAGDALQIIEMIMGEFSGLGLVDIIAVVYALYVMPIGDVLGFLDIDAYTRAQTILGSNLPAQTKPISLCMTHLAQTVSGFYQIMDQIFQDYLGNNALNL
jgi:hypothetical protein